MKFFKNPRFLSVAVGTAFAVSLLGGAPLAQAASLSSVQVQAILNLLQAFGADTATILNVQAALENTATSTQSTQPTQTSTSNSSTSTTGGSTQTSNNSNCAILSTNLTIGSTDRTTEGEVSRLQAFLGKDKSIYPEDAVTGYFGSSTLAAVQRWQAAQGIVSSGSSESTGYGNVGPLTRSDMNKELEKECEMGDSSSSSSSSDSTASSTSDVSGGENAKVGVGAHCGGFIMNAPVCAEGLHCQLGSIVDAGGTCVQNSEGSTGPTSPSTTTPSSEGN